MSANILTPAEDIVHSNADVKATLPIDGAALVGTAQAVVQLHDSGKIGVFGIGGPLPDQQYFANGSLQALFLRNEVKQGKLVMYVAKPAYENKLGPGRSFSASPLGTFIVSAAANKVTGPTKDTISFSKPLEFTKANYQKYDFQAPRPVSPAYPSGGTAGPKARAPGARSAPRSTGRQRRPGQSQRHPGRSRCRAKPFPPRSPCRLPRAAAVAPVHLRQAGRHRLTLEGAVL